MNVMRAFFCTAVAALAVHAAEPSKQSIERLLEVTEVQKLVGSMFGQVDDMMKQSMDEMIQRRSLPSEAKEVLDSFRRKMVANMKEQVTWDKMKELYFDIYRESFTQEELDGLIAFYESPAGKAFVNKMPVVMQKTMTATQRLLGPILEKIQVAMQEALKEAEAKSKETK
ncbi:MAG: DUF2059 domain-containing protein [Opitutaceae bacterium]|nr:DUF2059 domain-containing protein [Opitutaceae bacterium]